MSYQLAQVNIARMLAPLDDPIMAGFVNRLDEINALSEGTPGFIWRLQTPAGDATTLRPYDDEWIIINMSVWESIETLRQFAYYSRHVELYRNRAHWFEKPSDHILTLWWIPAGHIPTPDEAKLKLETIRANGPTPLAFTFKDRFTVEDMLIYNNPLPAPVKDS
jgi:hypothetical protein